ncbi:3-hydroxylacyl-ACP dehydratase [Pseudoduganella eburnea]|uniref:3-hydroxylacyl-ACP dehydratase n=1 Tax=Massilia eburnea TaxID=1776165 RepID=A0A6L6QI00_9BURK|nr:hotdog family protein [Massilia eburnea]MTW11537.1 3-hydroxylacyl-ACP dehydratase [Massilia eburnea]
MTMPDIRTLVPHGGAMCLLDRVLASDAETLTAEVAIHEASMFYSPEAQGVGSWVGIEYMAQAVAAHAGWLAKRDGGTVKPGFLLGSRRYSTHSPLFANGQVLQVKVKMEMRGDNGLGAYECSIADTGKAGQELASATLTVFQPDDVNKFLHGV